MLAPISNAFLAVLDFINDFVGNYAWSLIILTLLFKLVLVPLDIMQKKSLRKQKAIQPKLDALKAKYGNDTEKLNAKTMELYKKEGVNPLSGCLPLLIQLPILFAFFGAIRLVGEQQIFGIYESMKATGDAVVPHWLWIRNLWQADTFWSPVIPVFDTLKSYAAFKDVTDYAQVMAPLVARYEGLKNGWFILPLLAGATSYLQSRLSAPPTSAPAKEGEPASPLSGKAMQYIFPLVSVYICTISNSLFALYWITSNVASIISFWAVDKVLSRKESLAKAKEVNEPL